MDFIRPRDDIPTSMPETAPLDGRGNVREIGLLRPRRILSLAVWFALAAATVELTILGVQKYVFGDMIRASRDVIWLAPTGQLLLFVPIAAVLVLAGLRRGGAITLRTATAAFAFVAMFGVLVIPNLMHPAAAAFLAAGAAVQVGRLAAAHVFLPLVRRTTPALALLLAVPATAVAVARPVLERRALNDLADARPGAPNVILIIWDTVRAASLGLYGHSRPTTPNLEAFARRGVVFERAIATAPWTLPSHGSIFTGLLPHEMTVGWTEPLSARHPVLAEVFRDAGYVTGGFAANVLFADWEHGLSRGFVRYEDYRITIGQAFLSTSVGRRIVKGRHGWESGIVMRLLGYDTFVARRKAESVDREFLRWLDGRDGRPFFAFLNYFDAHLPYLPPAPFDTLFGLPRPNTSLLERVRRELIRDGFWDLPSAELELERAAYEASIAYLDHQLGELLDELRSRDLLESTIVIITSDHGEEFKEHGAHEHGSNLYLWQTQVPLVVVAPGVVPAGARVAEPVSLRDIAATVAELSAVPGGDVFPGSSLARTWAPEKPDSSLTAVLSELVPGLDPDKRLRAVMVDRHHYIRNTDGRGELYDVVSDPAERSNLLKRRDQSHLGEVYDRLLSELLDCEEFNCCCRLSAGILARDFDLAGSLRMPGSEKAFRAANSP